MEVGGGPVENMVTPSQSACSSDADFWRGKRVFLTGHTGFKGGWLALWLNSLGARVTGYALDPPTSPSIYQLCGLERLVHSVIADIRDPEALSRAMAEADPEIVFHLAAQPLVRESYQIPVETYSTNVMGTVHLLEAVRSRPGVRAVVNVTTDKCYENKEWHWGYRENEAMGGHDPYSSSKACSELVTAAYRSSFFNPDNFQAHGVALATARAGNVIGGGDWAKDRLVPDCLNALSKGETVAIRNPFAVRPWQHVLEPLSGYLLLARRLYQEGGRFASSWNFGPEDADARPVEWIVNNLCTKWGGDASYQISPGEHPHEARYLKLDCSKAKAELGWRPRWNLDRALDSSIEWARACNQQQNMGEVCLRQIEAYQQS